MKEKEGKQNREVSGKEQNIKGPFFISLGAAY
jgi:hypothetical protein